MPEPAPSTPSSLISLLLLLSFTTGLIDAVSVLGLAKTFSANMTGNIVFLGFGLVRTPGFSVEPNLVALATFLLGALIAGKASGRLSKGPLRRWLMVSATIEGVALGIAALLAIRYDPTASTLGLYSMIGLTAIAMGFRNATVRQLKVPDLTTTVLTLTITGLAADSNLAGGRNPNLGRRVVSVVAILSGAAFGAWLLTLWGLAFPLFLSGLLAIAGTFVFGLQPSAKLPLKAG